MKRKIFEEKLYLYIKGELSESEMREMKTEIDKSPDNRLLFEKMDGFLRDSKQLLKKVEIRKLETGRIVQIGRTTKTEHHHRVKIFQQLAIAASFLLILGLLYIFLEHNIIHNDQQPGKDIKNPITVQKIKESDKETTANSVNEKATSKRNALPDESMTASLTVKSGHNLLIADAAPVRRIVYLTDDPKVKIYWMTESN